MKIKNSNIYEGRSIYAHKKCIKIDVDLEGYCEIPSKDISGFNEKLVNTIPELKTHRCGIDEEGGFVKRLQEGTYLAHICEHTIIAIQNIVGIDVVYGKAREVEGDNYYIIFQYKYPRVGIEAAKLAVDLINSFIKNTAIDFENRVTIIKELLKEEIIGPSTESICEAAKRMNMPVTKLGSSNFYQIGYGKQGRIIEASIADKTSCISADISCDKLLTKELLDIQNLPVARGAKVTNVINLIKEAEYIGYPVVLKPQFGNKGKGVILNINSDKELVTEYQKLSQNYKDVIIEKYHRGNDYRVCIVDNKVVGASLRLPPFVIGDGKKSIIQLIRELNNHELRGDDHEKPLTKVKIDETLLEYVKEQGYEVNDVLQKDKQLFLRKNANLSTGGVAIDCTDIITEENKDICIRAAKTIGLDVCGVDICTDDISKPLMDNGIIMEINAAPGLRMHLYPYEGQRRDVGKAIVEMMYQGEVKNIPVVTITGTNGKTTTTRLINSTLYKMGYSVGMTSTEGIYINNKCLDTGDDTGADSAKCILLNREVEVAVLETARGGIIRRGLAYDLADVAVITNITEDHLGCDGVDTMEDLCSVKSLVGEAVKEDGFVVLNADDEYSREIISRMRSNIIYFSKYYDNDLVMNNIEKGGTAVYIKDGYICVNNNRKEYRVCEINNIPITLNGTLEFNIENSMAACGALVGLKVDYAMIKIGLETYELNSKENSGRFNMYNYNGVNVILDYGHNIDGYKKIFSSLKAMTNESIIGVIGVPGDRSDSSTVEIGRISAEWLDKIIIKEDIDKRGRRDGEVAELILNGVLEKNNNIWVKTILNEVEALKFALDEANKGDTIIVFFEKREPLVEVLSKGADDEEKWFDVANSL